jgi:hypothetical protein
MLGKIRPWNFFRAEPADMGRKLLAINEAKVPGLKLTHEPDEPYLRCIIDSGKHRLGKEGASDRHTVKSTDQATVLPCLDGMGMAKFVQSCIGVQHVTCDPGSSLGILWTWLRALFHNISKVGIERDGEHIMAKASLEAA